MKFKPKVRYFWLSQSHLTVSADLCSIFFSTVFIKSMQFSIRYVEATVCRQTDSVPYAVV